MTNYTIGVLGGMGTYATIFFFKKYAEIFKAEKEWDRPRIVIDNRCTMPSRVRAYLYKERETELIQEMICSMDNLLNSGCNRLVLACNTAHIFLPKIYKNAPHLKRYVVNLIDECINRMFCDEVKSTLILASEGTIESGIYQKALNKKHIEFIAPSPDEYKIIRDCIEAVKQNIYTEDTKYKFLSLVNRHEAVILGCTELPVLYEKYEDYINIKRIYDPLTLTIEKMKEEYDYEQSVNLRCL